MDKSYIVYLLKNTSNSVQVFNRNIPETIIFGTLMTRLFIPFSKNLIIRKRHMKGD